MKKSEIFEALAGSLDIPGLLADYPGLGREGLKKLLREAASAIGPGAVEHPKKPDTQSVKHPGGRLIIHTDGASRGNPGEAGIGVFMEDESGHIVGKLARYLGTATNNQAEYTALIDGLKAAHERGAEEVSVFADSELLVKQMSGEYRVKNPELQTLHAEATLLRKNFKRVVIRHVPRAKNAEADALANEAIDKRLR